MNSAGLSLPAITVPGLSRCAGQRACGPAGAPARPGRSGAFSLGLAAAPIEDREGLASAPLMLPGQVCTTRHPVPRARTQLKCAAEAKCCGHPCFLSADHYICPARGRSGTLPIASNAITGVMPCFGVPSGTSRMWLEHYSTVLNGTLWTLRKYQQSRQIRAVQVDEAVKGRNDVRMMQARGASPMSRKLIRMPGGVDRQHEVQELVRLLLQGLSESIWTIRNIHHRLRCGHRLASDRTTV